MQKFMGFIVIVLAIAIVLWWYLQKNQNNPEGNLQPVTLHGKIGGEKIGFSQDPKVLEILAKKGITFTGKKAGSVEMVSQDIQGLDFLWPANSVNVDQFRERGGKIAKADNVFNSPLVFYSWDIVTEALVKQGIVEKQGESFYVVDLPRLLKLIMDKKDWKDIGLNQLFGKIVVRSTDPNKSNSGLLAATLFLNTLNGGEVVTADKVDALLPTLKDLFSRLGYMENSSDDLFRKFLEQGVGAFPIIVGYENQIIDYAIQQPQSVQVLKTKINILYPKPTVWSSHPFIAINDNAVRMAEALKDKEILDIAWKNHGFRSGIGNDPKVHSIGGIPPTIDAAMPIPSSAVMNTITEALRQ